MRCAGPVLALGVVAAPLAVRVLYDARYHPAGALLAVLLARLIVRAAGQLDFQLLMAEGRIRPATAGYALGSAAQAAVLFPLVAAFGVTGLAFGVLVSTLVVSFAQAWLAAELKGGVGRMLGGVAWTAAGLAGAAGVEWLLANRASGL